MDVHVPYYQEKLWVAVDCLATSAAPLPDRMVNAGISALIRLHGDASPPEDDPRHELWEIVHAVTTELTAGTAVADEGTLEATVHSMSDDDLERIAGQIFVAFCLATDLDIEAGN